MPPSSGTPAIHIVVAVMILLSLLPGIISVLRVKLLQWASAPPQPAGEAKW